MYKIPVNQTIKNHLMKMLKAEFFWGNSPYKVKGPNGIQCKEVGDTCQIIINTRVNMVYSSEIELVGNIVKIFDVLSYITTSGCEDGRMKVIIYWNKPSKKSE